MDGSMFLASGMRLGSGRGRRPRMAMALIGAIVLSAGGEQSAAADDPKTDMLKADLDKLQGNWRTTAAWSAKGRPVPEDVLKTSFIKIEKDQMIATMYDRPGPSQTIRLDPSQTPKVIDCTFNEGDGNLKGQVWLGIYELDGDTLKMATDHSSRKVRPTGFETGAGWGVAIYKRVKP
jgi:uncharacterized protein (TIGR03067 family)